MYSRIGHVVRQLLHELPEDLNHRCLVFRKKVRYGVEVHASSSVRRRLASGSLGMFVAIVLVLILRWGRLGGSGTWRMINLRVIPIHNPYERA
jgi:hypothetical protein